MWERNDYDDYDSYKIGSGAPSPGWVPGCESAWQGGASSASSSSNRGRRHSTASDSGDTGIGTSCSDSVEDHSSSSGTLSFQPLRSQALIPTAHVMPSPSPSSSKLSTPPAGGSWSACPLPGGLEAPLDMKDPRPVRRWSSLTRLSGAGLDKGSPVGRPAYRGDVHGSLDRGLLFGYRSEHLQHGSDSSLGLHRLASSASEPRYRYDLCGKAEPSGPSPLKPNTLDLTYSALPESKPLAAGHQSPGQRGLPLGHPQAVGGSPIQPAVRTQMWLSEQMHSNPVEYRAGPELCGHAPWQQEQQQRERLRQEAELAQTLGGAPLPVNTLVKIKEGLLRQRELEIDRQKQQILQLHARIRENELRAQQVLQGHRGRCEDTYLLPAKESPYNSPGSVSQLSDRAIPLCCENGELGRKLAAAELEVIHLNEFLKQNTQKYTEDIKKLEEKMKTRDRYISSLKKKCQRESEQCQEKQQRVETLEKYLADLPSLDEVQSQAQQLEEVQGKAQALQEKVAQLEQSLAESNTLLQEKEAIIASQAKREKELVATVQSLQEKVEKCLEDGVRLPMLDLKQLERENGRLQEQHTHGCQLIDNQKKQIEKLTLELTAAEKRLLKEKSVSQDLRERLQEKDQHLETLSKTLQENQRRVEEGVVAPGPGSPAVEVAPLLKEMSLCLLDLKALCSILTQRAQGKEPNLALLLGIKSMSCSGEENERPPLEDGLRAKLSEVRQLRKDVDDLRTVISDRYAQDMGDSCITQ
ncbi:centrosomal protein of 85 kDa-like isoform X1 [Megalops cyprinoides]|uniref:centrosomal protein of 85 kDa-like isoform X1 n=1 Tax=Megalops cyprinoides TaxID=118141 RepID=UPI00186435AF|nr:centrosomal protein of 85 kDa-like isoform X1 [Megalops cyprinoides]